MREGLMILVAGALIAAPAAAETTKWVQTDETVPARLVEVGTWQFAAARQGPDGKPECYESWTFNADGTGLIVSGAQRVATRWEAARMDDLGQFVFVTNETSTDGPDCMGRAVDKAEYPYKSPGFQLIFFDNGTNARVCNGGKILHHADGETSYLLDSDDCWGMITALPKG